MTTTVDASKINLLAAVEPTLVGASKVNLLAVTEPTLVGVSKLMLYAVLKPTPGPYLRRRVSVRGANI